MVKALLLVCLLSYILMIIGGMLDWNPSPYSGCILLCPSIDRSGAYTFWPVRLSARPFVRLFVRKNFYMGHIFSLVRVRAFIFHVSIPCEKTFLLVSSSRSSVKVEVKYQGHSFRNNCYLLYNIGCHSKSRCS